MCKYCNNVDYTSIHIPNEDNDILYIVDNYLYFNTSLGRYEDSKVEIKYCPMCGKKLKKGE